MEGGKVWVNVVIGVFVMFSASFSFPVNLKAEDTNSSNNFEYLLKSGKFKDLSIGEIYNLVKEQESRQIISSVDGLGAAVDSLKANDAAVIEYHDKRVFDYKVGSLSGGKDVYVKITANGIGPGGYSLIFEAYLLDRNNSNDTIYLGGVALRRWGMPHTLRNSPIERRFAYLWEDVQSFIKALRVYEFKDENGNVRYVAFFAAQEYLDEIGEYNHYYNIVVIPEEWMKGEGTGADKKSEPYMIVWRVPGVPEEINNVYFASYYSSANKKFYYSLMVSVGDGSKGYTHLGFVDEREKSLYWVGGNVDLEFDPIKKGKVYIVSLGDDQ